MYGAMLHQDLVGIFCGLFNSKCCGFWQLFGWRTLQHSNKVYIAEKIDKSVPFLSESELPVILIYGTRSVTVCIAQIG